MNTDHRLLNKIAKTHRGQTYFRPLLGGAVVLSVFWLLLWKLAAVPFSTAICIAMLGLLTAMLAFRLILRATRKNLRETATAIDAALASHNQMEALVELKDGDHPLRARQEELSEQWHGHYKPRHRPLWLGLLGALICLELGGFGLQLFRNGRVAAPMNEEPDLPATKENEFAELALTHPESEIRLKPMDEVAWKGTGRSSKGFDDLSLSIYRNGEPVADIPLANDSLRQPGDIELSGAFYLDELNAEPFDVISYHLAAHSEVNGIPSKKVVSIPGFIEVRPFREDAEVLESGDGMSDPMQSILDMIHKVLEFQLILNKAVYAARSSGLAIDDLVFQEQIALLKQEQRQLKDTLSRFLDETDPTLLSANMTTSLRSAERYMETAGLQLARIAPAEERTDTP